MQIQVFFASFKLLKNRQFTLFICTKVQTWETQLIANVNCSSDWHGYLSFLCFSTSWVFSICFLCIFASHCFYSCPGNIYWVQVNFVLLTCFCFCPTIQCLCKCPNWLLRYFRNKELTLQLHLETVKRRCGHRITKVGDPCVEYW